MNDSTCQCQVLFFGGDKLSLLAVVRSRGREGGGGTH
jgi:hypothetical protein